jgi:hypothetical protein
MKANAASGSITESQNLTGTSSSRYNVLSHGNNFPWFLSQFLSVPTGCRYGDELPVEKENL